MSKEYIFTSEQALDLLKTTVMRSNASAVGGFHGFVRTVIEITQPIGEKPPIAEAPDFEAAIALLRSNHFIVMRTEWLDQYRSSSFADLSLCEGCHKEHAYSHQKLICTLKKKYGNSKARE